LLKPHLRILPVNAVPPLRVRRDELCAQVGADAAQLRAGTLFIIVWGANAATTL
jgi:hypothetical protein